MAFDDLTTGKLYTTKIVNNTEDRQKKKQII
jgi:hypothetical protein